MYRILLVCFVWVIVINIGSSQVERRDVAFCDGSSQTSVGWNGLKGWLVTRWSYRDLIDQNYTVDNGVNALATYINGEINHWNGTNVFGIAHGYGGLALRQAQFSNPNISAMILNGVPNQGSQMVYHLTRQDNNGFTEIEKLIKKIEEVTKANNCEGCNGLNQWKDWAKEFKDGASSLGQMSNRNDYFEDTPYPTVPFIVMYGLLDRNIYGNFTTGFMDSNGSSTGTPVLKGCFEEQIRDAQKKYNHRNQIATIRNVSNFITNLLSSIGTALKEIKDLNPGAFFNYASSMLKNATEAHIKDIELNFENNIEITRMLRCRLAHQVFEAEWFFLMGPGDVEENTVSVIVDDSFDDVGLFLCQNDCWANYPFDRWNRDMCMMDCANNFGPTYGTKTFYTFIPEPSDGLFTQSEMQLSGSVAEIIMPGVDHFGETRVSEVYDIFNNQIFAGAYGAAFQVPLK